MTHPHAFEKFGFGVGNVYPGQTSTVERDGFTLTARIYADDDTDAPWERQDGHGEVTGWTTRGYFEGERVLSRDGAHARYYDFAGAVETAKRDGWGAEGGQREGETAEEYATRAAESDFEWLRAWCNDEWSYVGVAVTVSRADVQLTGEYEHARWGIDSTSPDYIAETAEELAAEALDAARAKLAELTAD